MAPHHALYNDNARYDPATVDEATATWRFDGFCGQLRVTVENGDDWYVTVLAPSHFVGALLRLPQCA